MRSIDESPGGAPIRVKSTGGSDECSTSYAEPALSQALPRALHRFDDVDSTRLAYNALMSAGIAHDLCNMLQIASSAVRQVDRSLDRTTCANARQNVQIALEAIDRAGALGRRAIEASRPENLAREAIDIRAALEAMADLIVLAAGPTIAVELMSADDVPPILCDRLELESAVLNLVVNARDAMSAGGRLTLSVYRENSIGGNDLEQCVRGPRAVLQVRDTGCGMSDVTARQIFRPFFTTKTNGRGTGLGLAMVGDMVRRTGGSAEVESELGRGTAIILRFPTPASCTST